MRAIDLTGQRFGRLVALERDGFNKQNNVRWLCICDCANFVTVLCRSLRSGNTTSCGCLARERSRERALRNGLGTGPWNNPRSKTHGESNRGLNTPEYRSWASMLSRCRNPRDHSHWSTYGGRGITVCERWNDYRAFLADMGRRPSLKHSIDRIDNNGNYEPSNCRWATPSQQQLNTRRCLKSRKSSGSILPSEARTSLE
jgi:hypothetical protein